MGSAFEGRIPKEQMIYVSRGNISPTTRSLLIESVQEGEAIQLQTNDLDQKSMEIKKFFTETFLRSSKKMHPFGYHRDITLFITGPGHQYNDHCDGDDGFLFQLHGVKRLQMWGPKPAFFKQMIFNLDFRGNRKMFEGSKTEYEIRGGQGIFIPRGVMHRVVVPKGSISVSLSIRMDHHYPFLEVVRDLARTTQDAETYTLSPDHSHWDKFRAMYFDPSKHPPGAKMPLQLKKEMLHYIHSKNSRAKENLPLLLDRWWKDLSKRRNFCPTGPLPAPPENRLELLRKWEIERLGLASK